MVSVKTRIARRVEIGQIVEDWIKEGRTKGSWEHIKQSDKVQLKAWIPPKKRENLTPFKGE